MLAVVQRAVHVAREVAPHHAALVREEPGLVHGTHHGLEHGLRPDGIVFGEAFLRALARLVEGVATHELLANVHGVRTDGAVDHAPYQALRRGAHRGVRVVAGKLHHHPHVALRRVALFRRAQVQHDVACDEAALVRLLDRKAVHAWGAQGARKALRKATARKAHGHVAPRGAEAGIGKVRGLLHGTEDVILDAHVGNERPHGAREVVHVVQVQPPEAPPVEVHAQVAAVRVGVVHRAYDPDVVDLPRGAKRRRCKQYGHALGVGGRRLAAHLARALHHAEARDEHGRGKHALRRQVHVKPNVAVGHVHAEVLLESVGQLHVLDGGRDLAAHGPLAVRVLAVLGIQRHVQPRRLRAHGRGEPLRQLVAVGLRHVLRVVEVRARVAHRVQRRLDLQHAQPRQVRELALLHAHKQHLRVG